MKNIQQNRNEENKKPNVLPNNLKYDPQIYMKLTNEYTVAIFRKYKVTQSDYVTLKDGEWLSDTLIAYIFNIFNIFTFEVRAQKLEKSIQFEVLNTMRLFSLGRPHEKIPKIEKNVLIAALLAKNHFTLFIIVAVR